MTQLYGSSNNFMAYRTICLALAMAMLAAGYIGSTEPVESMTFIARAVTLVLVSLSVLAFGLFAGRQSLESGGLTE